MLALSVTWADVAATDLVFAALALLVLAVGLKSLGDFRRVRQGQLTMTGHQVLGALAAFPLALLLGYLAYHAVRTRYLLRGDCRYTAARVYENRHFKGDPESRFEYWVRGVRYTFDARMDWRGGWRPLHSYWYVRFAVPDPSVAEYLDQPVADSVRYAPAAGWAQLPSPATPPAEPLTVPPPQPAAAPGADSLARAAARTAYSPDTPPRLGP